MLLLMLTSCASGNTEEIEVRYEKPVLKIYLFAPDSPIVTRADIGDVEAAAAEKAIKTIDVWVFEHDNPEKRVSYVHLDNITFDGQKEIVMELTDDFANLAKKPDVDIYVAANASNLGLTLNKTTTIEELKAACIGTAYFGVYPNDPTKLVKTVPDGGLPMSGMLEKQVVGGIPPVYTAKNKNVQLVRAVSKIRFILSKSSSNAPTISNLSIKLDADMIPNKEFLFLEGDYPDYRSNVNTTEGYESEATIVTGISSDDINSCNDPAIYAYTSETGQAYETKIDNGLKDPEGEQKPDLTQVGLFYFRESDKQLKGSISYKLGTGENDPVKNVEFKMSGAGDFTRNHTWIVYGYFLGSGDLKLNVVDVKEWTTGGGNSDLYNW